MMKIREQSSSEFFKKVKNTIASIPRGETRTYKQIAQAIGRPKAYRAVGNALNKIWQTDHGQTIPCHRVVRSDGKPGGYAGGKEEKIKKLASEQN